MLGFIKIKTYMNTEITAVAYFQTLHLEFQEINSKIYLQFNQFALEINFASSIIFVSKKKSFLNYF